MRPTMLAFCAVNHTMPLPSMAMVWGSLAFGSGILYSLTSPVLGSSLPTRFMWLPVNQMLPSLSSTRPCGPVCGVALPEGIALEHFNAIAGLDDHKHVHLLMTIGRT